MTWTPTQLQTEWNYVYHERLGILGCYGKPTVEQDKIARKDADETIAKLREQGELTL